MGELTLMQKFSDPALIDQLSGVEKMTGGLVTTMMGMGITFVVLSLLWGLIAIMTKILDKKDKKSEQAQVIAAQPIIAKEQKPAPVNEGKEDETILVAVITAALAATLNQPASSLMISKIRRSSGNSIAWSQAGSSDSISSRRL